MKKSLLTILLLLCVSLSCLSGCGPKTPSGSAELTALKITQAPAKTAYVAGERFDKTGLTVMGVYADGSETEITAYTVDPSTLAEGDTAVTLRYKGLSVAQAVTVSAAAPVASSSEALSSEVPSSEAPDVSGSEPSTGAYDAVTLVNAPVRTSYVAGECFDPVGILLCATKGTEQTLLTACSYPTAPLSADTTAVTVSCGGVEVDVPVTVVAGSPLAWTGVPYTQETVDELIEDLKADNEIQRGIDVGLVYNGQVLTNMLPHKYAAGVASFAELLEEVDYHLFYGRSSIVVKLNYDYGDLEQTLDRLYYESGFVGACMSIQGQALADGCVQIIVKYYADTLMSVTPSAVTPNYLDFAHTESARPADYKFSKIDAENGIAVYNSEQAVWALTHGYSIAPVPGSPVEAVLSRAEEILIACCDDSMTPYQKMYNLYYYIETHVVYDFAGEEWVGLSPDPANESDLLSAMLVSFRAEGPLLYGNATCYGYAKSMTLLLALEGLDVTRVVSREESVVGRSQYEYNSDSGQYQQSIGTHSYSYVRIDGSDYLIDGTYAVSAAPDLQGQQCMMYRDFCVGYSKQRHAQVYKDLQDDWYCASADYRPADFDNERLASYDGGAHDCLLESYGEVSAYLNALAAQATKKDSFYAFSVTAAADGYADVSDFLDTVTAQMEDAFGACYHWRYARPRNLSGVDCYTVMYVIYPA